MPPSPCDVDRPGLAPEAFARLEVCLLSATPRLSDAQVMDLADALHSVVRARRRRPFQWLAPPPRPRWRRRDAEGKVVELWPGRG